MKIPARAEESYKSEMFEIIHIDVYYLEFSCRRVIRTIQIHVTKYSAFSFYGLKITGSWFFWRVFFSAAAAALPCLRHHGIWSFCFLPANYAYQHAKFAFAVNLEHFLSFFCKFVVNSIPWQEVKHGTHAWCIWHGDQNSKSLNSTSSNTHSHIADLHFLSFSSNAITTQPCRLHSTSNIKSQFWRQF